MLSMSLMVDMKSPDALGPMLAKIHAAMPRASVSIVDKDALP